MAWKFGIGPSLRNTKSFFGHAMCVLGYDNKKFGGAFEIMNSWGSRWGQGGFIWVKYEDFIHFAKYAYLPMVESENAPMAVSDDAGMKPKKQRPSSSSKTYVAKANKKNQFGQTSSQLLDMAGEIKLIKSGGEEMSARLYGNLYRTREKYPAGTRFQVSISSVKNSYVYVLGVDNRFQTSALFPKANGGNALIEGGNKAMLLPDKKHYIEIDQSSSERDYLCVIFSKKFLNLKLIQESLKKGSGSLQQRLQTALGPTMINARNIQYENGRIAFSSFKDPGQVLGIIIETRRQP